LSACTNRWRLWHMPVSGLCEFVPCVACVRWILCITYVALNFLRKTIAYVPFVITETAVHCIAVVEFCVYLIRLSLWYCKSQQRSFVRFLVLCVCWSQKVALCFIPLLFSLCGGIAAGVQTVNCDHAWSRLTTLCHSSVGWVMAR